VIVPIYKDEDERQRVMEVVDRLRQELGAFRLKIDDRTEVTPGFKFNDWEMRGVPLRIEIGPRDVEQNAVVFARRDVPGKEGKTFGVPVAQIAQAASDMLTTIQAAMLQRATEFREANTRIVRDYDEFKQVLDGPGGFIRVHWAGSNEDEDAIKDETKATIRCYPFDTPEGDGAPSHEGVCFYTGKRTSRVAIFARAY
jgi:prolyl-tRNA synthetase